MRPLGDRLALGLRVLFAARRTGRSLLRGVGARRFGRPSGGVGGRIRTGRRLAAVRLRGARLALLVALPAAAMTRPAAATFARLLVLLRLLALTGLSLLLPLLLTLRLRLFLACAARASVGGRALIAVTVAIAVSIPFSTAARGVALAVSLSIPLAAIAAAALVALAAALLAAPAALLAAARGLRRFVAFGEQERPEPPEEARLCGARFLGGR